MYLFNDSAKGKNGQQGDSGGGDDPALSLRNSKFQDRLKLSIFNIFCTLLKNGLDIAPWKVYLLVLIEFVQFL
jgi:hypothetical protein